MKRITKYRYHGISIGAFVLLGIFIFLSLPQNEHLHVKGPLNTGHENLKCEACHKKAQGTMRQQLQAQIKYTFNLRKSNVPFGSRDIDNKVCMTCHERANDRHPVLRFTELRFKKVRAAIAPHKCESCHKEHSGVRVTIQQGFCKNCHEDIQLKKDPLNISHKQLASTGAWTTCLQCHDFHGNYVRELPVSLQDTIPMTRITEYLDGSASPYGDIKEYESKKIAAFIKNIDNEGKD